MRLILIFNLFILSTLTFATDYDIFNSIELKKRKIFLGRLNQQTGTSAEKSYFIKRSKKTPKKVKIQFAMQVLEDICVDWVIIHQRGGHYYNYNPYPHYPGPYYPDTNTVCVRWEKKLRRNKITAILDFTKAAKLTADRNEIFKLNIFQLDIESRKVRIEGETVESDTNYEIVDRNTLFKRIGLNFIAQ